MAIIFMSRDGNFVACLFFFFVPPLDTVILIPWLPNSAPIFTAYVWAINKALQQLAKKYFELQSHFNN